MTQRTKYGKYGNTREQAIIHRCIELAKAEQASLRAENARLRKALEADQRVSDVMETAPKDGTPVLGWVPTYYQGKGSWVVALYLHGNWMDNRAWAIEPKCWIPLPSPPVSGERKP